MEEQQYLIVINQEEQYSIWPAEKTIPAGWQSCGGPANKETCLEQIREIWQDMRPASLRKAMAQSNPS